jgi:tape measure domain-containing protein
MGRHSELAVKFTGDARSLSEAFRVVNADLAKTAAQVNRQTVGFRQMGEGAAAVGQSLSLGITVPLVGLGAAALKSAGAIEQTGVAFTGMLKSSAAAKAKMEELKAFAASSPFEFPELADSARRMLALGISAKDVVPTLRTVGDAASALGIGAEGINRITLAIGQMKLKGTAQAEEMRQLAEAGIPAWDALAKKLNVDVAAAMKMVENRSVSAQVAIDAVTEAMTERFGGGMAAQAMTLVGMWSNVRDSVGFALADIGKSMAPAAKMLITDFIQPSIEGVKWLAAEFAELPVSAQAAVLGLAGITATAGPVVFVMGQLVQSGAAVATAWPVVTKALAATGAMAVDLGAKLSGSLAVSVGLLKLSAIEAAGVFGVWAAAIAGLIWELNYLHGVYKQYRDAQAAMDVATKSNVYAQDLLIIKLQQHGVNVAELQQQYKTGMLTYDEFLRKLRAIAAELGNQKKAEGLFDSTVEMNKLGIKTTAQLSEELKKAKELLSEIAQEVQHGTKSHQDLANAQDRVRQINEQLHPSLRKTKDVLEQMSGPMQGPISLMDELSSKMAQLAQADANQGMQATAQAIYDVAQKSADASNLVADYAKQLYGAGLAADVIAGKMTAVRDAILNKPEPVAVDFSQLKLDTPWTKEDQAQLNELEKSIRTIETVGAKEEWKQLFRPVVSQRKMLQEVSTIMNDLDRGIASAIVHWKGFGDVGKQVAQDIAQAVLRNLIRGAFAELSKSITGCFGQLQGLGGALSSIFGGGSSGGLLSGAVGLTGIFRNSSGNNPLAGMGGIFSGVNWSQFPGAPTGAASSAVSAGLGGIMGIATGAISAVTGIISGFQGMATNKSLDVLVRHTLQITLQLEAFMKLLDVRTVALHDRLMEFRQLGLGVWPQEGYAWAAAGPGAGGGGGITINNYNPGWIGFRDMDAFWAEAARQIKARL